MAAPAASIIGSLPVGAGKSGKAGHARACASYSYGGGRDGRLREVNRGPTEEVRSDFLVANSILLCGSVTVFYSSRSSLLLAVLQIAGPGPVWCCNL